MSHQTDDSPPASPDEALRIIGREQTRREADIAPYFVFWGLAWMAIGLAWFGAGTGAWPPAAAGIATAAATVLGVAASMVFGWRVDRGVHGPTRTAGTLYGVAWGSTMVAATALAVALSRFADPAVVFPGVFVFVVGTIYLVTAALCRSPIDFGLGLTLQLVAVATVLTPEPYNALVMALGGGVPLVVVGLVRRGARR